MRRPGRSVEVRAYADAPLGDRLHVWGRWATCPFDAIERSVPRSGRILDLGCGHGLATLLLARSAPERSVVAVDPDRDKIALLDRAAAALGVEDRVDAVVGAAIPAGPFDAVVIVDVLYLLPAQAQRATVAAAAAALRPGGRLVLKELERSRSARYLLARLQEQLAVHVLGITEGEDIEIPTRCELVQLVVEAGLVPTWQPLRRGELHPHQLVVGTQAS